MTLNSAQLRQIDEKEAKAISQGLKRHPVYIILENVLDTYNIGGFFRLADAVAAKKVYLCGQCATPPDHKIVKASVRTYKLVPWEHKPSVQAALSDLRSVRGLQVIAVEQHATARDYRRVSCRFPIAFIFGHETNGVSDEALDLADDIIEIPMYGINKSLNVMVAAGIALFHIVHKARRSQLGFLGKWRRPQYTK